jgi:hypothetical protein
MDHLQALPGRVAGKREPVSEFSAIQVFGHIDAHHAKCPSAGNACDDAPPIVTGTT